MNQNMKPNQTHKEDDQMEWDQAQKELSLSYRQNIKHSQYSVIRALTQREDDKRLK